MLNITAPYALILLRSLINVSFQRSLPVSLLLSFRPNLDISVCLSRYPHIRIHIRIHTHANTKRHFQSFHRASQIHTKNAFALITPSAHEQPLRLTSRRRSIWRLLYVPLHRAPVAVCKMERRNGQSFLRTGRTIPTGIKMHSRQILPARKPPASKCFTLHGRKRVTLSPRSGHQPWQLQGVEGVPNTVDWLGCLHVQRRRDFVTRDECLRGVWSCLILGHGWRVGGDRNGQSSLLSEEQWPARRDAYCINTQLLRVRRVISLGLFHSQQPHEHEYHDLSFTMSLHLQLFINYLQLRRPFPS